MEHKIQIAITDDHTMVLEGLQRMLTGLDDIEIGACYKNGQSLLAGLQKGQPDVLLLDIHLTDYVGEDLIPVIVKNYPGIRILAITSVDTTIRVKNLIKKGCLGYLSKNASADTLIEAIRTVYKGLPYVEEPIKNQLFEDMLYLKKEIPTSPQQLFLTRREKEVLQLIAREHSSKEIADTLFISINTVEIHRKHLFQKLDVKNLAGLIRKALLLGFID